MNPATPPSRQGTAPTAAPPTRRAAPATADDAAPAPTGAWQASVGAASNADLKLAMAASGTVLSVFTVGHMAGNMQVYLGRERYNRYALLLRHAGAPVLPANTLLWAARIGLLASTATHVAAGTELTLRAWRAEGRTAGDVAQQGARNAAQLLRRATDRLPRMHLSPSPRSRGHVAMYREAPFDGALLPGRFDADAPRRRPRGRRRSVPRIIARSMRSTGAVLGLFVTYHVLDLTTGTRPAASRSFEHGDAYGNLVGSLSRPVVAVFYTTSMAALAGHMVHGLRTAALDTGLTTTARRVHRVDVAAKAAGAVVAVGNASIPLAVSFKVVR
ncbi:hypothetical protein [Kocuria rhizophila]|uniref:hypothetical protein n=2 Tax=Kocuria TaxID=57493 RepID=UPI0021A5AA36|nr:hypothetical protein [Kocuria rhizophila]MCT1545383.1 hypothetical protein [Kocuria rhizophila]MCT2170927.1 hypothetical protein [Kocuria rhizophila]